jgi:hypothetical protein
MIAMCSFSLGVVAKAPASLPVGCFCPLRAQAGSCNPLICSVMVRRSPTCLAAVATPCQGPVLPPSPALQLSHNQWRLPALLPASLTRWHSRARALKASGLILNFWLWQVTSSPRVSLDVVCRKEAGLFELSSLSGECTHATPPPVARVPGWRYRSPAPPPPCDRMPPPASLQWAGVPRGPKSKSRGALDSPVPRIVHTHTHFSLLLHMITGGLD